MLLCALAVRRCGLADVARPPREVDASNAQTHDEAPRDAGPRFVLAPVTGTLAQRHLRMEVTSHA